MRTAPMSGNDPSRHRRAGQPVCFPPVASGSEVLLILGSFPGRVSLERGEYYAHPRNSFWPIIGCLLDFDPGISYRQRLQRLSAGGIALWDVLGSCARDTSLDSSIRKESMVLNDFEGFFARQPALRWVVFNGALAESEFRKKALALPPVRARNLGLYRLPSTSPALATLDFQRKLQAWRLIGELLAGYREAAGPD